jgi:hypothetical protein
MLNDDKLLKSGFKRCETMRNGEERECQDDEILMDYG